jgi:hypothetical protein
MVSPCKPQTRGPVRALPKPYKFSIDPHTGTPHLLCNHAASQSHTFTHSHKAQYFHPAPWTWKTRFHPPKGITSDIFSGSWLPSASWGSPEFEPRFLPIWGAGLPSWFLSLSGFLCATRTHLLRSPGERVFPSKGRGSSAGKLEMLSQWQGDENTALGIPDEPPDMLQ